MAEQLLSGRRGGRTLRTSQTVVKDVSEEREAGNLQPLAAENSRHSPLENLPGTPSGGYYAHKS